MGRDEQDAVDLIRLLHGELPPAEAKELSRRLAGEADLLATYRGLEKVWGGLGPDPGVAPRPGFATALLARARAERETSSSETGFGWSIAPAWAKAVAVLALGIGAALGSLLMSAGGDPAAASAATSLSEEAAVSGQLSAQVTLGEGYASALQSGDTADSYDEVRQ